MNVFILIIFVCTSQLYIIISYPIYALYIVKWSELANARAFLARLASSFLFIGVEKGDFSVMAAAMVAWKQISY